MAPPLAIRRLVVLVFAATVMGPAWAAEPPVAPLVPIDIDELFADANSAPPGETDGIAARARLEAPQLSDTEVALPVETIVIRDDAGRPVIEKTIERTPAGDLVEHGPWRAFSADGTTVTTGSFAHGKRTGHWLRKVAIADLPATTAVIAQGFEGPFVSVVEYREGKPNGTWRMSDSQCGILFEIELVDGLRHGRTTYYYPGGAKRSEAQYVAGKLHGTLSKISSDAKSALEKVHLWGRAPQTKQIRDVAGKVVAEESWLAGETVIVEADDPLNGRLATFARRDNPVKHGEWTGYDAEGQIAWRCRYVLGELDGPATWYYASGQKRVEGNYATGKPSGKWSWWHASGTPSIEGEFVAGEATGQWLAWNTSGKVQGRKEFRDSQEVLTRKPTDRLETPTRGARLEHPDFGEGKRLK